jgi:choline kinase
MNPDRQWLIILAAGEGRRLRPLTDRMPKCLVEVNGRPLLDWQLCAARDAGIRNIAIVRGFRAEAIQFPGVSYFENPAYASTNMVESLWRAESVFGDGCIVSYGDIVYEPEVLRRLLASARDISVVVDRGWQRYWGARFGDVLADAESLRLEAGGRIAEIGKKPSAVDEIDAQYIGLTAFQGRGVEQLRAARDRRRGERRLFMTDLLQGMIDDGVSVHPVPIARGWLEVDSMRDLELAERALRPAGSGFSISDEDAPRW